ncbi:hypothetical protein ACFSL4_30720 [Streptomyces caeni]|uniref:Uncharacterized protein n=1 Tax=Streptomyces caeni TaxID=2307231 RepID=A0ABW4IYI0_9ACTN
MMGRQKPNRPRRTPGVRRALLVVDHAEDAAGLALLLAAAGCPHCGGRAQPRPGPTGFAIVVDHRDGCPELADPGQLTPDHDPKGTTNHA